MSSRRIDGGRLIDREKPLRFTFNGKNMKGFEGDTLASALLANRQILVGRSFKYHRPRGIVTSGPEEPNALMGVGTKRRFEPNVRATTAELFDGMVAESQNHWPSLEFDVGAVNNHLSKFFPAGFYYKTFIHPRPFWKHVFEPVIRQAAGLGKAPRARDADTYEHFNISVDVLVTGGGIAGLAAALAAGRAGAEVLLLEQAAHWGGRAPVDLAAGPALADPVMIGGQGVEDWIEASLAELQSLPNVHLRARTTHIGAYDHGYNIAVERLSDHAPGSDGPRQRFWRIRASRIVTATGALERPISFVGNDLPGVMLASAMRDYVVNYGVSPGRRTVVVTTNDDGYRTAFGLRDAGMDVPLILDARSTITGALPLAAREAGFKVAPGKGIGSVSGKGRVEKLTVASVDGTGAVLDEIPCDAVAIAGGWSPAVHLWSQAGGKLDWDEAAAMFLPDPDRPPLGADGAANLIAAGAADGALLTHEALASGWEAGAAAADALGQSAPETRPEASASEEAPTTSIWLMPRGAGADKRAKAWLDFQNDVKVSDVELASQEGYLSVEHAKRYTTLGMATDQGKLSNINGLAVLAEASGRAIPEVGTTTFRPPYTPVTMGAIAGEARGKLFQPLRRTPIHGWHEALGAHFEPVGQWRRPYAFPAPGEDLHDAVNREITTTRHKVGLVDASTLGKILVKGPDAGKFLDMVYTGRISTLKPGRCRYGLMCNEGGYLMDDGVVARIDETTFLCHTTSGGADHVHGHLEEWLQTEWWDWQVHTANVTEAYGQIGVAGPEARTLLETLGGMDLSEEALPFMGWVDCVLGGFKVRVYRISFSGELSFEVAVAAGEALALWERLMDAGAAFGAAPYGTEALHVMRAEKGFIMIGDETDGTVIPQDLGLDWAISKKKDDYIGKRGQERMHMTDPDRWRLVGLETTEGGVLAHGALALDEGKTPNGQRATQGRVTSTYYSPILKRGVALGLVRDGPERMGEILTFSNRDGPEIAAKIVPPGVLDGEAS
ncbi:MAG: sarcosine oxidase subunit alpha family protein [Pseudomonadota bacterium]